MYRHIIYIDEQNNIIGAESLTEDDEFLLENPIIFETSEEKIFEPEPGHPAWGVFAPDNMTWIPCYRYDVSNHLILKRSQADIDSDIASIPEPPPSILDRIESQVFYTAMMTDTLLEEE